MAAPPASSRGGGGVDRLSSLPDEILAQILSYLPAQVASRTCVLARSWRGVWKITRRLRITGTAEPESVREVRGFVDRLLGLRLDEIQSAPLDACEITLRNYDDDGDEEFVQRWISRALECQVRELRIDTYAEGCSPIPFRGPFLWVGQRPLVSSHLTRLVLHGVDFSESFQDFSSCHVLEDLDITNCILCPVERMISPSLKCLSITDCSSAEQFRFSISAPCLVSLRLDCPSIDKTPRLEGMPKLVVAYVQIGSDVDCCDCDDLMDCHHVTGPGSSSDYDTEEGYDDAEEGSNDGASKDSRKCVLLGGLSEATNLTLLCDDTMCYLFRRDLRWCPTFWKLKTLVLSDYWCEPADCRAIASILEHAPVLEKLTVLFSLRFQGKYNVEVEGHLDATKKPTLISQHLMVVKVKCGAVDERVLNVLNFLGTVDIRLSFKERKV